MQKNVYLLIVLLLTGFPGLHAQDLNLFQSIESNEDESENSRRPQRQQQNSANPAFTLVGTSRFGDRYLASLMARNGTSVVVEWEPGLNQEIQGHLGYSVASVNSRYVTITLPETDPCISNEEKGVECINGLAKLSLSNAAPIEAPVPQQETTVAEPVAEDSVAEAEIETSDEAPEMFRNPFTGEMQEMPRLTPEQEAERAARRARRAEQFKNFEIVRIADDEIPEGMRRVRTPFGDSLEPIEE